MVSCRKYFNESYYYLDESVGTATPAPSIVPDWDIEPQPKMDSENSLVSGTKRRTAIPAHLFIGHVGALHANDDIGFSKEYEALQASATQEDFKADLSIMDDNKLKNRYHNVVACKDWITIKKSIQ